MVSSQSIFTARIRRMGKVIFSVCLSVFRRVYPGLVRRGYPSQVRIGGTMARSGRGGGLPQPSQDEGGNLARNGVSPIQKWGTNPHLLPGRGYLLPPSRDGVPPPPPPRNRTADGVLDTRPAVGGLSCVYFVGKTPTFRILIHS